MVADAPPCWDWTAASQRAAVRTDPERKSWWGRIADLDPRNAVRQLSFWTISERARKIGAGGAAAFLSEILGADPGLRVHGVAHSMGASVLLNALCTEDLPRRMDSLLLAPAGRIGLRLLQPGAGWLLGRGHRRGPGPGPAIDHDHVQPPGHGHDQHLSVRHAPATTADGPGRRVPPIDSRPSAASDRWGAATAGIAHGTLLDVGESYAPPPPPRGSRPSMRRNRSPATALS